MSGIHLDMIQDPAYKAKGYSLLFLRGKHEGIVQAIHHCAVLLKSLKAKDVFTQTGQYVDVQIKQHQVGKVIGKGGENLEKWKRATNCDIQMDQTTKTAGYSSLATIIG